MKKTEFLQKKHKTKIQGKLEKNKFPLDYYNYLFYNSNQSKYAGVVELADTQDLGSCAQSMQVRPLSPAPILIKVDSKRINLIFLCFFACYQCFCLYKAL